MKKPNTHDRVQLKAGSPRALYRELSFSAGCSILCGIHSAYETQPNRNSCPEFAFLPFSWTLSCRCHVKFFHFYVMSALQLLSLYFYFWLIRTVASSYVHQQHFRSRSIAFSFPFRFPPHIKGVLELSRNRTMNCSTSQMYLAMISEHVYDTYHSIKNSFPLDAIHW